MMVAPWPMLFEHPVGQTDLAQPGQIGDGVLAAGQDDEIVAPGARCGDPVSPGQQAGNRSHSTDAESGRPRSVRRPAARWSAGCRAPGCPRRRAARPLQTGTRRSSAMRSALRESRTPSSNSERSPRNLLIAKPRNSDRSSALSSWTLPITEREHPAALDVGDQQPRRADPGDQAEIDQIVVAQVQLADAAGALDDDHVESARQIGIGLEHRGAQFVGVRVVLARGQRLPQAAVDDHLAGAVAGSA